MLKFLKALLGSPASNSTPRENVQPDSAEVGKRYTTRLGEVVEVDEIFDAWTSGELSKMLKALKKKTNLIDRHFLLLSIVEETYKNRTDAEMRELCKKISELHIVEFPRIAPALKKEMDGELPFVPTFQKFSTLLTEDGEFEKAIEVCEAAISFGLRDGTKGGFEARIEKIKKKIES